MCCPVLVVEQFGGQGVDELDHGGLVTVLDDALEPHFPPVKITVLFHEIENFPVGFKGDDVIKGHLGRQVPVRHVLGQVHVFYLVLPDEEQQLVVFPLIYFNCGNFGHSKLCSSSSISHMV